MLRRVCGISFDVSIYLDVIYSMVFEWVKETLPPLFPFGVKVEGKDEEGRCKVLFERRCKRGG